MHSCLKPARALFTLLLISLATASAGSAETRLLPMAQFRDRLRGGWAGQMIGVSFGSVYEFQSNGKPITGPLREWKPEFVANSIQQDDIYVEMTFLKTLETRGLAANHQQAGIDFRDSRYRLWHANMAARENLKQGIMPPMSGHPRYNPHADDIDFQIEADLFGLIAPGLPRAAAEFSDRFGSIMNYGDGLYGGRFVTAMYCQAYLEQEPTPAAVGRCLDAGLAAIPPQSDYAKILQDVRSGFRRHPDDWLKTWQLLQDHWGEVDLCPEGLKRPFNIDAKLNGAYIALGLLYGGGDFARTLEITTRCGQDADCNPSNAAGVLGAIYGYSRIPAVFTASIPALTGQKFEYTEYDFPALIAACERVSRRVVAREGGRVRRRDGVEVIEIPIQKPGPPGKLEQMQRFPQEQLQAWAADFEQRRRTARSRAIPVERWASGWRLVASGDEMDPGVRAVLGRSPVLVTHPVSTRVPAAIEKRVRIPGSQPRLRLTVTSATDSEEADWELRVLVDGKLLEKRTIQATNRWEEIEIDLGAYAGREVTLRLENAAGGARQWAWEAGYWARADVTGQ
jgi:hypothetical protein